MAKHNATKCTQKPTMYFGISGVHHNIYIEAYHMLLTVKALVLQTKLQHAASTLSSQI